MKETEPQKDNIWEGKKTEPSGLTGDLEGRRGVRPTSASDRELIQTLVKQIKSEIYGWTRCGG